jgi:hypothetical protein
MGRVAESGTTKLRIIRTSSLQAREKNIEIKNADWLIQLVSSGFFEIALSMSLMSVSADGDSQLFHS